MPWYQFHLILGDDRIDDPEGLELSDRASAIHQSLVSMREMLAEDIRMGRADMTMRIEIVDDGGAFHVTDCAEAMASRTPPGRIRPDRHRL